MPPINEIDRRTDVVFILFHEMESIRGVTKVQKLLFLIEQETDFFEEYEDDIAFNFAPYKMGPFSEAVYEELHFMLQLGAIEATPIDDGPLAGVDDNDLSNKKFSITPKGKKIASQLVVILEPKFQAEIEELVELYGDLSLPELLEVVYTSYPAFATESEIKDELQLGVIDGRY